MQGRSLVQPDHPPSNTALSAAGATTQAPAISLPKGGGALRGIGEKFSVNPSNGSASLSVPLFTTPSRSNFYPQLGISYDSGSGNGIFGLGWKLSIPSITRKTDKGLPQYRDQEDSDIFILSDAEDLVPRFAQIGSTLQRDLYTETMSDGRVYAVQRYSPRVEGLFARIEKWQDQQTGDVFWKSISKDNIASVYGRTPAARVTNTEDPSQVFQWLLEESYDDKGNSIRYEYKQEDRVNVPRSPEEANRQKNTSGLANRHIKRIRYGKAAPTKDSDYLFLVVFDYGEHDNSYPTPTEVIPWPCRLDPFSNCRPAFEVRTYRLCRRVLMFHNFSELNPTPYLVRSTDLTYDENATCSYLSSVTQAGYVWDISSGSYQKSSFPPIEFTYSQPTIDPIIRFVDRDSLKNLPVGLDEMRYRWVDLDSEGISGILTELPEAWYYKRNLGQASFAPSEVIARQPSVASGNARQELLDLAGDGKKALVQFAKPVAGFSERDEQGNWGPFTAFEFNPSVSWSDPNLRMVDLNGDGFSDVLISEEEVFTWYPSCAKRGFGSFQTVRKSIDEECGPKLIFADAAQSIYLADMTGDGLTDIVRIRNGEVCYWMNLGFGRFSQRVAMSRSPFFDHPDSFNQKQIRLADIDGSGTTDILYLGHDSIAFWFNQSGNSWSDCHEIRDFPRVDDFSSVSTVDLFGNGTSCLVWSSPLPQDTTYPMAYIDLMSGKKSHMLESVTNNLGKKTQLEYAASTTFYLADREAGEPWVTRLPFPVQVVRKTTTCDGISNTQLTSSYTYHHGFYDGVDREFRGFGRVDQRDTQTHADYAGIGEFPGGSDGLEKDLYVPPVLTKTWFHTGAFFGRRRISRHFAHEYYKGDPAAVAVQDSAIPPGLTGNEEREACRALKGRMLRQEIYAEDGSPQSANPYSVVEKTYSIRMIQPLCGNPHAVFLTNEKEILSYHYERNPADPRINHELTLEVDSFGNVTKSASIAYPRRVLTSNSPAAEQLATLCTYSEVDFINQPDSPSYYRIAVPFDSRSYEITGSGNPSASGLYDFYNLLIALPAATEIPYEAAPSGELQKRLFQRTRSLYLKNDLSGPLPLGQLESLALPYETYQLAFTPGLLASVYSTLVDETKLRGDGKYLKDADYIATGIFPNTDDPTLWWMPSGTRVFDPNQFYQPVQFTDPWGNSTAIAYDSYALLTKQTTNALGNKTSASSDYRVMLPYLVTDANGNQSQAAFDVLGMVVGTAVMGKAPPAPAEGDSLAGFQAQLDEATIRAHIKDPLTNPAGILQSASTRLVYDLHAFYRTKQTDANGNERGEPVVVYTLARETHVSDLGASQITKFQHQFLYSDGFGRTVQTKIVAEPGLAPARGPDGQLLYDSDGNVVILDTTPNPRWIGTGRTVYDNKGNPVKKFEPFFSSTPAYEDEKDLVQTGVTPILRYDPPGRLIRTDKPNGTFTRVEFDPWQQISWDENDTVLQSLWYVDRGSPNPAGLGPASPPDTRAAWLAAQHANTPTVAQLDVLGRTFVVIADNGVDINGTPQKYPTRTTLDIQGNPRIVTDARLNPAMTSDFDMMKRVLHTKSIDAGERWTLQDAAGRPIWAWDSNQNQIRTVYDELHRPTYTYVQQGNSAPILAERIVYADRPDSNMASPPEQANLRGKVYQSHDAAGQVTNQQYDFKGNLLVGTRRLTSGSYYKQQMDWTYLGTSNDVQAIASNANLLLEKEAFTQSTSYDALNRIFTITTPDQSVTTPAYNERRLLYQVAVHVAPTAKTTTIVGDIGYNEKGQRLECDYGNSAVTAYSYDRFTYRLTEITTTRPNGAGTDTLQDLSYYYDPVGNIVEIDDGAQPTIFFSNAVVTASAQYTYDPIYRLTQATGREHLGQAAAGQRLPPPQYDWQDAFRIGLPQPGDPIVMATYLETYQYDPVGNISQISHQLPPRFSAFSWTRNYQNDAASNRLLSSSLPWDSSNPPFSAGYQYDPNGNTTKMLHLSLIQWTYKNELQATAQQNIGNGGSPQITYYVYDATGQRVRKVTESATGVKIKERTYLGAYEAYREYSSANSPPSLERQTLHIMDDKTRAAMVETKTIDASVATTSLSVSVTRYQFSNHLGSASLELDDSATPAIISYEEFYPYGNTSYQAVSSTVEVSAKRYRYTGKERDDETGFSYHGARYYAPWLGRWPSCDPLASENAYSYASNRPLVLIDSSGRADEPPDSDVHTNKWMGKFRENRWREYYENRPDVEQVIPQTKLKDPITKKAVKLGPPGPPERIKTRQPDFAVIKKGSPNRADLVEVSSEENFASTEKQLQASRDYEAISRGLVGGNERTGYPKAGGRFEAKGLPMFEGDVPPIWEGAPPGEPQFWQAPPQGPLPVPAAPPTGDVPGMQTIPPEPAGLALGPKAVGSALAVANVVQVYTMARDMTIQQKSPGRVGQAILEDEGGKYVIKIKPGIIFNDYYKTYINGEGEGTTVELGFFEFLHEVGKRNDKYGYFDWKGDWVYGEQAPIMLPPGMI
jgi:RHS repeat-associated protein